MLAEIGIVYGQQEATWQDNYELIKAYVEKSITDYRPAKIPLK